MPANHGLRITYPGRVFFLNPKLFSNDVEMMLKSRRKGIPKDVDEIHHSTGIDIPVMFFQPLCTRVQPMPARYRKEIKTN